MNSKAKSVARDKWYSHVLRWQLPHIVIAGAILALDYSTGDMIQFPIAFVIPVALASWYCNSRLAYILAVLMPSIRFGFAFFWHTPLSIHLLINIFIRIAVLLFIAFLARKAARLTHEIKLLHEILPMCSFCKKIRDKNDHWQQIESFISKRTDADVTHGICPECAKLHYGEILNETGAHS